MPHVKLLLYIIKLCCNLGCTSYQEDRDVRTVWRVVFLKFIITAKNTRLTGTWSPFSTTNFHLMVCQNFFSAFPHFSQTQVFARRLLKTTKLNRTPAWQLVVSTTWFGCPSLEQSGQQRNWRTRSTCPLYCCPGHSLIQHLDQFLTWKYWWYWCQFVNTVQASQGSGFVQKESPVRRVVRNETNEALHEYKLRH